MCCGSRAADVSRPGHEQSAKPPGMPRKACCAGCAEKKATAPMVAANTARVETATIEAVPEKVYRVLHSPGVPLDPMTRRAMELRFRRDLSGVRLHVDSQAAESAEAVFALAYAYGNHIVFGPDQFDPWSLSGKRILVHELTHVVQQISRPHSKWQWPEAISDPTGGQYEAEAEWMALNAIGRSARPPRAALDLAISAGPLMIARLGANPGCTQGQRETLHQAIFNANAWVNNSLKKLQATPVTDQVRAALRRNFGNTYGVVANLQLFIDRLQFAKSVMNRMPVGCNSTDQICLDGNCGFSVAGSVASTICTQTLAAGVSTVFIARCVLHEAFHAAFSRFVVDHYSDGHGTSTADADYPGAGVDPLLNADSYTTLAMDLS
jgi:hypothetical protein